MRRRSSHALLPVLAAALLPFGSMSCTGDDGEEDAGDEDSDEDSGDGAPADAGVAEPDGGGSAGDGDGDGDGDPFDLTDDANLDPELAWMDLVGCTLTVDDTNLTATMTMAGDFPDTLAFNHPDVGVGTNELVFEVYIDVDDDTSTGCSASGAPAYGAEYSLGADHTVDDTGPFEADPATTLDVSVGEWSDGCSFYNLPVGTLSIDGNTLTMTGPLDDIVIPEGATMLCYTQRVTDQNIFDEVH